MRLERYLQISMATLVALSALVLGMGERNYLLPVLAIIVSSTSVYLTDIRGWLRLNAGLSFWAALIALVICLGDLLRLEADLRLLALANLLVYLQCVLLYRQKDNRIYWQLAVLSLLEVGVASALNDAMLFGFLLVLYFLIGVLALTLFLLLREGPRVSQQSAPGGWSWPSLRWLGRWWRSIVPQPAVVPIRTSAAAYGPAPSPESRWPLAGAKSLFVPPEAVEPDLRGLAWGLARHLVGTGVVTIGLTAVLFLTVPRLERSWQQRDTAARPSVGYSDQVILREFDEIVENPDEVIRVEFSDLATNREYLLEDEPLLKGTLLTHYERGSWQANESGETEMLESPPPSAMTGLVRQKITVEPLDTDALFAVYPIFTYATHRDVLYDSDRERLSRPDRRKRLTYGLLTSGFRDGRQSTITPQSEQRTGQLSQLTAQLSQLTDEQKQDLTGLSRTADEAVKGIAVEDVRARCLVLERFLRDSGRFGYTLRPPIREGDLDPIEDFVVRSRAGHCEYFASALALMLRSQGIPARLVVGFKGGDYNMLGRFYQVRQLHAHTWVEAYLRPAQLPPDAPALAGRTGGWLRLDPTPGDMQGQTASEARKRRWPTFREIVEYTRFLWSSYVVSLDAQRQRETIYAPVSRWFKGLVASVVDTEGWLGLWRDFRAMVTGSRHVPLRRWFDWRAGVVVSVLLAFLLVSYRLLIRLGRRLGWWRRRDAGRRKTVAALRVDFYERLERLLSKQALIRPDNHTQREFAVAAGGQLAERSETQSVAGLPRLVAEAFYRVRFGRRPLDKDEAGRVESALTALDQALAALAATRANGRSRP